jgi:hypothetical protein
LVLVCFGIGLLVFIIIFIILLFLVLAFLFISHNRRAFESD